MAYERTWQFIPVQGPYISANSPQSCSRWLWNVKSFLKGEIGGATQGLWTCVGSSDGATAALDGVDRWTTTYTPALMPYSADAVGTARAWMVLSRVVGASTVYLTLGNGHGNGGAGGLTTMGFGGALPGAIAIGSIPTQSVPIGGAQGVNTGASSLYATDTTNGRRYFGAISTVGDFWFAETIAGEIASGIMFFSPVGTKVNDQWPFYCYGAGDIQASYPWHVFSGTSLLAPGPTPALNTGKYYNSAAGYYFLATPPAYTLLDSADISLFDYPAWCIVGNATAPTALHSRGRLPDTGLCAGNVSAATAAAHRPCNVGTTIRDASNAVQYITMNQLILPYNNVIS